MKMVCNDDDTDGHRPKQASTVATISGATRPTHAQGHRLTAGKDANAKATEIFIDDSS